MGRINALVRRELKRMVVSPSWLVLMIIQPVAYLTLFALVLSKQFRNVIFLGRELTYLEFLLPGLLALQTNQLFHVLVSLASADRRFGVFPAVMMAGTKAWEYIVAEVISHSLATAAQGVLILIIGLTLIGKAPIFDAAGVVRAGVAFAVWSASLVLWTTLGLMIGLRAEKEEKRDVLWALLNLPLMFSSSVFYDVSHAPTFIQILSYANPLTYCADALRICMYGNLMEALWRFAVLIALASLFAAICLWFVRTTPLIRTAG